MHMVRYSFTHIDHLTTVPYVRIVLFLYDENMRYTLHTLHILHNSDQTPTVIYGDRSRGSRYVILFSPRTHALASRTAATLAFVRYTALVSLFFDHCRPNATLAEGVHCTRVADLLCSSVPYAYRACISRAPVATRDVGTPVSNLRPRH